MHSMQGKFVLVAASSQGIGKAIAQEAGTQGATMVIINGRVENKLAKVARELGEINPNTRYEYIVADMSVKGEAEKLIKESVARTDGKLDVVINSAGVSTRASIEQLTYEVFDELFHLNIRGAMFLCKAAIEHFESKSIAGSIVNNISVNAVCGQGNLVIYAASKGALETFTKTLGHECAMRAAFQHQTGNKSYPFIRVNGINTGWVLSDGEKVYKREEDPNAADNWFDDPPAAAVPRGTMTTPKEIAKVFVDIAGYEFLNAQILTAEQFCLAGPPPRNIS